MDKSVEVRRADAQMSLPRVFGPANGNVPAMLVLMLGMLAIAVPTLLYVARESWSTEQGAHGPIVLMTHSQSGSYGLLAADRRPNSIRALLHVEGSAPPVRDSEMLGAPNWFRYGAVSRPWGLTAIRPGGPERLRHGIRGARKG